MGITISPWMMAFLMLMTGFAGFVDSAAGGGGLGSIAIIKGLNIRKFDVMYSASLLLVAMVQIITVLGTRFTRRLDHKRR